MTLVLLLLLLLLMLLPRVSNSTSASPRAGNNGGGGVDVPVLDGCHPRRHRALSHPQLVHQPSGSSRQVSQHN